MRFQRALKQNISLSLAVAGLLVFSLEAQASNCRTQIQAGYQNQLNFANQARNDSTRSQVVRDQASMEYNNLQTRMAAEIDSCERGIQQTGMDFNACNDKKAQQPGMWKWDGSNCVNLTESRDLNAVDECSNADVFAGQLRGQNCRKAMNAVSGIQNRNSAVTDAATAATSAYGSMQAMQATGAQSDAQVRQANIMKALAISKLTTGAMGLEGAMELQNAASGASGAHSTISSAQQELAAKCNQADSEAQQTCFYQNASKYGISADQQSYANFERMRTAAQQSQDQADAASGMAKTSLLSGAADLLVGLQAMKMARQANTNSDNMALPPRIIPPPTTVNLGGVGVNPNLPSVKKGGAAPIDYGMPNDEPVTFGDQKPEALGNNLMPGKMGALSAFKPASSNVSGGGGGGMGGGGGGGGGKPNTGKKDAKAGRQNSTLGEYNMAGGSSYKGGGADKGGDAGGNPITDMLSKLFPTDSSGKPVVDARQIASTNGAESVEGGNMESEAVTATDVSLFEQVSAKYRQMMDSGRI